MAGGDLGFGLWIAAAVVGTAAGVSGLARERAVIGSLHGAAASTATTAFVVGAVVGLLVTALQVTCAVLDRQGHARAGTGLVVLAVLLLVAVALRLAAGDVAPAAAFLLALQALLLLAALAVHRRSRARDGERDGVHRHRSPSVR